MGGLFKVILTLHVTRKIFRIVLKYIFHRSLTTVRLHFFQTSSCLICKFVSHYSLFDCTKIYIYFMHKVIKIYSLKVYTEKIKIWYITYYTFLKYIDLGFFFLKKSHLGVFCLYLILHFQTKAVMRLYTVTGRRHLKNQDKSKSFITNSSYIILM